MELSDIYFTAFVDDRPDLIVEAERLSWSLVRLGGVSPSRICLHLAPKIDFSRLALARGLGVRLVHTPTWPGLPTSNKIHALKYGDFPSGSSVLILDCDTLVLRRLPKHFPAAVAGKLADKPIGQLSVFQDLFQQAGVPFKVARAGVSGEAIPSHLLDGGVYFIHNVFMEEVKEEWPKWIRYLMRQSSLDSLKWHFDEIAMALAIGANSWAFKRLPPKYNFPVNLALPLSLDCRPIIVHYREHIARSGRLRRVRSSSFLAGNLPRANRAASRANVSLNQFEKARSSTGEH